MNLAATALTLFLVFDPFGNMVIFHTVLAKVPAERRRNVMIRELLFALLILLGFLLAGSTILSILGVRPATLSISGGILLFLIALGMVFPAKSMLTDATAEEPFIVPLAVPLIAGPSSIALLLLLSNKYPGQLKQSALALGVAWGAAALILLISPLILKLLGNKGTAALERLMGLLLILIAVQMFLDGLAAYTAR
ncbi:MAG: YhgN family NAAT transporter [Luteolibacter sp.]